MPELPEVVTVCKMLKPEIVNKTIIDFQIFYGKLLQRPSISEFKKKVINQKILNISNFAKYIVIELANDVLISHLRMEGKWIVEDLESFAYPERHLEAQFILNNNKALRYYDTRKFGTLELLSKNEYKNIPPLSKLGPDPTKVNVNAVNFHKIVTKSKRPIKTVLLDQSVLSGLGNIYVNEVLFEAKINPNTPANEISLENCGNILKESSRILKKSIEQGGTSIHSFESAAGVTGNYQNYLKVHGKSGNNCVYCGSKIQKEFVGGRGTYFCPKCQK
ncbi:formamidopyrimidine-DNA glycosylase [Williamsoniiplasma somnilux]|uniref:Formamidopyrimidine-DNA glycosylase n=1 Tax=Williamsoniiplasma somnilux TaxID=215578 RepID=A0A2K8NXN1_9MOLU|nr:DNA-formamidopyrimidine glycosylase [Williamsoniiplasma somnilux]ATZ18579.1 formamidopyrimidine-DNA glycosylase [Williamsoniiplasma somnilux]